MTTKKGIKFGLMSMMTASKKKKDTYVLGWMTSTGIMLEDEADVDEYIKKN